MNFLQSTGMPLPKPFVLAAQYTINAQLQRLFQGNELSAEELARWVQEAKKWSIEVQKDTLAFVATSRLDSLLQELTLRPEEIPLLEKI